MNEGMNRGSTLPVILSWLIGLILIATALAKLLDIPGFSAIFKTYQIFPEGIL
ncbi:MAG: hypothetical protein H7222_00780 [Methylotenera sp.]|nr:hypothetical protein [Oligoflexia bacterium]